MTYLAHIADRVINRPLLITPEKASVIVEVLSGRIGVNTPSANRFEGEREPEQDDDGNPKRDADGFMVPKPYRSKNGVGILSIAGSLVTRGAWIGTNSGLVSYEAIQYQLGRMAEDDAIKAAIVEMHTPGGEAVLAFETAAAVRRLAKAKRTVAIVNGMAASAGYAIASGASEVVTVDTGISGSIGVVLLHADFSRHLANEGISPTLIFAGAHKVDGNPFEPLTDAVREDLQAEVNAYYEKFLETVAAGRGKRLTIEAARSTEARIFIGDEAVKAGLADRIGTFEDVLSELSRGPAGRSTSSTRRTSMTERTDGAPAADSNAGNQASATSATPAAPAAATPAAASEDPRARIKSILGLEEAKGREAQAQVIALETDLSVDDAKKVLGASGKAGEGADPAADYEADRVASAALAQPAANKADPKTDTKSRWGNAKKRAGIARR